MSYPAFFYVVCLCTLRKTRSLSYKKLLLNLQPIGVSGKTSIVDILDDFLRQRFGEDSYERIDNCLTASKKQAATKIFNDKNNKRFFFLMETSACHPSIKLSSIDAIIIFDSDWNPMNDIRSLQKLTLDSQFESIKTFRLYSPFTVEEKALILSRQGKTLDINCPSSSRGLSHTLLMWGAVHLFDELRVFHDGATSTSNLKPLLEETVSQFSSCLADVGEDSDTSNCSILLKVQQHGGAYLANSPLFGELEFRSPDEESPQKFWNNLLVGRQFQWKYSCGSTQRSRRRVQPFNNLAGGTDLVNEGTTKKRLKVSNNNVDQPSSKSVGEKLPNGIKAGTFVDLVDKPQGNDDVESGKNGRVHDELRSLHLSLKPQITELCEVLLLPDNVRNVVDNFLEYVTNKHHFNWESVSIQSFQISLIRAAASLLNHKVDQKTILALSKEQLNFDCKQAEVDYSYSFLQCLKKIFVYRTGTYNDNSSPKVCKSLNGVSCTEVVQEVELFKKDLSKSIKKIQKKFVKMLNKVRLMYQEEKHRLRVVNEDEKAELERKYKIQLAMTRSCYPNEVVRTETLNILNVDHQKSIEELKCEHETRLKELEDEHSEHIRKYQVWEASWVEEVKSWAKNELLNIVASKGPGTGIDYLQMCDNVVESMIEAGAMVTETNSPSVGKTVKLQNSLVKHDRANEMDILVPNDQPISGSEDHNMTENQYSQENIISKHSHSREQNSDGATSMTDETNRSENFGHESQDGCERSNLGITSLPDYENATHTEHQCSDGVSSGVEGQIPVELQETTDKGDSVSISERQVQVEMPVTDNSTDCQLENANQLNPPSSMDQTSDKVSIDVPVVDGVLSSKPCQAVGLTGCQDKISLSNPPLEQQIPDGDVPVMEPENSHAVAECHMEPSINAMLVDNSTTDDQEGGVQGNVTSAPVPRPVNVMEPLGQGKELPSVKSAADKNSDGAMQNSSEQVQVASSSADVVPANQITVPSKQVHQLAAAEPSSNLALSGFSTVHLATEDEHQLNSVHSLPTHHSEPTSVVPNKDAGQSHSNSALGLHSNQVAVHPISNSDLDLLTASRVRAQCGYRRNLSNPLEMNNHPIQSTPPSSSRRLQHLSYDPLNIEFERIQKVIEQSSKNHEDTKLRLKSDFEKELAELRRKYDVKFQEIEVEFQQTKKTLDTNLNTVYVNKILANAFKSKCLDLKVSGASGVQHDSLPQHLHQLSRQQAATRPFLVSGSSSGESPVTSLPSPSIAPNSQHMLPPGYNMSGTFSSASARPPLINTTRSSIARDIQGGEIRAPAPHLHSSRPSISAPPSSFNPLQRGIPSQTAASNLRATSPSYAHVSPWQRPPSYQSNPQMGRRPDSAGRSALLGNFSSQSTKTPPNIISRLSDVAPANLSRSGPNSSSVVANSSHQAASQNLVCLSDDE
ncbi:putative DNA helicase [Medicago truncatula]|uniref:Putative DNA helicase n=1 Tax=Medicago truncatula TaxID=3880 RepID=A0A396JFR5_MEDTR|nr:putative DNA helicase [Medicago truncatula]